MHFHFQENPYRQVIGFNVFTLPGDQEGPLPDWGAFVEKYSAKCEDFLAQCTFDRKGCFLVRMSREEGLSLLAFSARPTIVPCPPLLSTSCDMRSNFSSFRHRSFAEFDCCSAAEAMFHEKLGKCFVFKNYHQNAESVHTGLVILARFLPSLNVTEAHLSLPNHSTLPDSLSLSSGVAVWTEASMQVGQSPDDPSGGTGCDAHAAGARRHPRDGRRLSPAIRLRSPRAAPHSLQLPRLPQASADRLHQTGTSTHRKLPAS